MIIAWILSVMFAAFCGYWFERLKTQVNSIVVTIQSKVDKKPVNPIKSVFLDPDDPLVAAKYEFEEKMKKLNPGE